VKISTNGPEAGGKAAKAEDVSGASRSRIGDKKTIQRRPENS
jgi:hypothetical protein